MVKSLLPLLAFVMLSIPHNRTLVTYPKEPQSAVTSVFIEVASVSSAQIPDARKANTQAVSATTSDRETLVPLVLTVPRTTAAPKTALPAMPSAGSDESPATPPEPTLPSIKTQPAKAYQGISVGDTIQGELTHYCVCKICCGKENGVTASGLKIKNGMTDPRILSCNWLPFGATVRIHGEVYTVSDRGGSGLSKKGRVDIFTPAGHQAALTLGRQRNVPITILSLP